MKEDTRVELTEERVREIVREELMRYKEEQVKNAKGTMHPGIDYFSLKAR